MLPVEQITFPRDPVGPAAYCYEPSRPAVKLLAEAIPARCRGGCGLDRNQVLARPAKLVGPGRMILTPDIVRTITQLGMTATAIGHAADRGHPGVAGGSVIGRSADHEPCSWRSARRSRWPHFRHDGRLRQIGLRARAESSSLRGITWSRQNRTGLRRVECPVLAGWPRVLLLCDEKVTSPTGPLPL